MSFANDQFSLRNSYLKKTGMSLVTLTMEQLRKKGIHFIFLRVKIIVENRANTNGNSELKLRPMLCQLILRENYHLNTLSH